MVLASAAMDSSALACLSKSLAWRRSDFFWVSLLAMSTTSRVCRAKSRSASASCSSFSFEIMWIQRFRGRRVALTPRAGRSVVSERHPILSEERLQPADERIPVRPPPVRLLARIGGDAHPVRGRQVIDPKVCVLAQHYRESRLRSLELSESRRRHMPLRRESLQFTHQRVQFRIGEDHLYLCQGRELAPRRRRLRMGWSREAGEA